MWNLIKATCCVVFAGATISVVAQPVPLIEASTNQVAAGTLGNPYYVSPRGLSGAGFVPGGGGGGGSTLPTNGLDSQTFIRGPGGTVLQTNENAFLGYGLLTNKNAFILYGDSRAKSDNSGATTIQSYLTNTYLAGSNWRFITNGGIGGQTVATMQAAFPAFINDYKATTAAASGTNVIVINMCGINDIVGFVGGAVVASNYDRMMWLERQSNCIVVAVTTSPAYGLTDSALANLKIFNDLIMTSTNWQYLVPAHQTIPPPPQSGMWADNIHNNSVGNDRLAFYINLAFLSGIRNSLWFTAFNSTLAGQMTGSAADSTGQASTIFGVGSTTAIHIASSSGANAWGETAFGDTMYEEWNSASGSLAFAAANLRAAKTPTNTFFYGINAATNMSGFTTVTPSGLNTIAMNQGWTNNFNQRADLIVEFGFVDAVTGDPVVHFTNSITGESYTNALRLAIAGNTTMLVNFTDISPKDFGSISNYSGTGASVTINKARWKLK